MSKRLPKESMETAGSTELPVRAAPKLAPVTLKPTGVPTHAPVPSSIEQALDSRKRRRAASASLCVYFPDLQQVHELQDLCAKMPRATVSNVLAQLAKAFVAAAKEHGDKAGPISLTTQVHV